LKLIDPVWGNYFAKCPRFNPSDVLKQLRPFELDDPKVRSIPSKRGSEIAEACLFCFGLSCRMGCPIWVIDDQSADHDFLAFRKDNGDEIFYPIQLKRVVPERVNAQDTLQSIIEGLAKYVSSGDLAVAISVNRRMDLDPDAITVPPLPIKAIWIYGCASQDRFRWFIHGNLIEPEPITFLFDYPR
jgi:hypothetical protein